MRGKKIIENIKIAASIFLSIVSYMGKAAIIIATVTLFFGWNIGLPAAILMALSCVIINTCIFYLVVIDNNSLSKESLPKNSIGFYIYFIGVISLMILNAMATFICMNVGILAIANLLSWEINSAIYSSIAIVLGVIASLMGIIFESQYIMKFWNRIGSLWLNADNFDATYNTTTNVKDKILTNSSFRISEIVNDPAYKRLFTGEIENYNDKKMCNLKSERRFSI